MRVTKKQIANNQRKAIKIFMAARDLSVNGWCKDAGLSEGTLRNFLKGVSGEIGTANLELLANAAGVMVGDILNASSPPQVPVLGKAGAGDEVIPLDDLPLCDGFSEHDKQDMNCEFVDAPPGTYEPHMIALRVVGDSMEPYVEDGELVFYSKCRRSGFNDLIGRKVVAKLKDGRCYIKTLQRGYDYGKYNLHSVNSSKLIENVELEWVALIVHRSTKE